MKVCLLLALIPSLIAADILCPNSKTTCPNDKQCCETDGEFSCCDRDGDQDDPARNMKVYPGVEMMSSAMFVNASIFDSKSHLGEIECNFKTCKGTCCGDYGCCFIYYATCCEGNYRCCPKDTKCCYEEGCCDIGKTCCGKHCCEKGYTCSSEKTCVNKGVTISPEIVAFALMALSVFISNRL